MFSICDLQSVNYYQFISHFCVALFANIDTVAHFGSCSSILMK